MKHTKRWLVLCLVIVMLFSVSSLLASRKDKTPEPEPEGEQPDLEAMTKAELSAILAEWGVDVPSGARKAELIALVEENFGGQGP